MKVLKARNEGQDQNFRIKQLKKARYKKKETQPEISHISWQAKSRKGHEKPFNMFKIRGP